MKELFKGESTTRRAEVKVHNLYINSWRACLKGYNTFSKKWKVVSNVSYKSLKSANKAAEKWIQDGIERDALLKSYGKDPLTYN